MTTLQIEMPVENNMTYHVKVTPLVLGAVLQDASLDVTKEITFEEAKNFFSATSEFTIEDLTTPEEKMFKLTLTNSGPNGSLVCSTIIQIMTYQRLIRSISQLSYNMAVSNHD